MMKGEGVRGQATPRPQHYANEELQTKMKLAARQTLQITPLPTLCVCVCVSHTTLYGQGLLRLGHNPAMATGLL